MDNVFENRILRHNAGAMWLTAFRLSETKRSGLRVKLG